MKLRQLTLRASAAVAAVMLTVLTGAAHATIMFTATLDGLQETPVPVITPASGTATGALTGSAGSWVFEYSITYADLTAPIAPIGITGAHLHEAPPGVSGGVKHFLDGSAGYLGTTDGTITGDWRYDDASNPLTDDLANALLAGNIYINLHTQFVLSGEIRGQYIRVPEPAAIMLLAFGLTLLVLVRRRRRI